MDLRDRTVVVTGASRGIGRALAEVLAARGARVALVARTAPLLEEVTAATGGAAFSADLSDPAAIRGVADRIESELGSIDVLVNNAGVERAGPLLAGSDETIEELLRINLLAPVLLSRQVLPGMLSRGHGHIVNVSSLAGVAAVPGLAVYCASKAGLTHFTAGLRAELRGTPVGTTLVELGPVRTEMLERVYEYSATQQSFSRLLKLGLLTQVDPEQVATAIADAIAHGRRHVRVPRRATPLAGMAEAPRRMVEAILTGVRTDPR